MSDADDPYRNYRTLRTIAQDVAKHYATLIEAERARLAVGCPHPAEFVVNHARSCSNGYGSWSTRTYQRCTICEHENHWGRWAPPPPYDPGDD